MTDFDQAFPPLLAELHEIEIDFEEDEIDFEPYQEFLSAAENAKWIRAWTGNSEVTGEEYRVFGQDGTGGYAAFWLVREAKPLLEQPIVFFGSEGDAGVVATDFADYLWLLAGGLGPLEAVEYGAEDEEPHAAFTDFAIQHAPEAKKTTEEVLSRAQASFPKFEASIQALCR